MSKKTVTISRKPTSCPPALASAPLPAAQPRLMAGTVATADEPAAWALHPLGWLAYGSVFWWSYSITLASLLASRPLLGGDAVREGLNAGMDAARRGYDAAGFGDRG